MGEAGSRGCRNKYYFGAVSGGKEYKGERGRERKENMMNVYGLGLRMWRRYEKQGADTSKTRFRFRAERWEGGPNTGLTREAEGNVSEKLQSHWVWKKWQEENQGTAGSETCARGEWMVNLLKIRQARVTFEESGGVPKTRTGRTHPKTSQAFRGKAVLQRMPRDYSAEGSADTGDEISVKDENRGRGGN